MKQMLLLWLCVLLTATVAYADKVFVQAENFAVSDDGWVVRDGIFTHLTSGKVLGVFSRRPACRQGHLAVDQRGSQGLQRLDTAGRLPADHR